MKVVGFAIFYLISWPINKKHDQLLFWYLFQVFIHKLEMYVKFPITAVPSLVITDLTQQTDLVRGLVPARARTNKSRHDPLNENAFYFMQILSLNQHDLEQLDGL